MSTVIPKRAAQLAASVSLLLVTSATITASAATLNVDGRANIYGAGHGPPNDTPGGGIPPVEFEFATGLSQVLRFSSVTGTVDVGAGTGPNGPDGNPDLGPFEMGSFNGISGIKSPSFGFLMGTFLDSNEPVNPAPSILDFTVIGTNFTSLSPQISQTFFIGDGRTDTGERQKFIVPSTATRLFLGLPDRLGGSPQPAAYNDNDGSYTAKFQLVPSIQLAGFATTSLEVDGLTPKSGSDLFFRADSLSPLIDDSFDILLPGAQAEARSLPQGPLFSPDVKSRAQVSYSDRILHDAKFASATATAKTVWRPVSSSLPAGTAVDATMALSFDGSFSLIDSGGLNETMVGAGASADVTLQTAGSPSVNHLYSTQVSLNNTRVSGNVFNLSVIQLVNDPWAGDLAIEGAGTNSVHATLNSTDEIQFTAMIGQPVALEVSLTTDANTNGIDDDLFALADFFSTGKYSLTSTTPGVTFVPVVIPEPSTLVLTALGLLAIGFFSGRRQRGSVVPNSSRSGLGCLESSAASPQNARVLGARHSFLAARPQPPLREFGTTESSKNGNSTGDVNGHQHKRPGASVMRKWANNCRAVLLLVGLCSMLVCFRSTGADDRFWQSASGGAFENPFNWSRTIFPGFPDFDDTAIFDLADQSYTVTFGISPTNAGMLVGDDQVTFDLAANTYTVTGTSVVGEFGGLFPPGSDNGVLNLTDGTFATQDLVVGQNVLNLDPLFLRARGTVNVDGSSGPASLEIRDTGTAVIGDAGNGTLNLTAGGKVTAVDTFDDTFGIIGDNSTGIGTVNVDGFGSRWSLWRAITVGSLGTGTLNITDGGKVNGDPLSGSDFFVGFLAGSSGTVLVDGGNSLLAADSFYVGGNKITGSGTGAITVQNNGTLSGASSGVLRIYAGGTVTLNGGTIDVGRLENAAGGTFDWQAGRLRLTAMDLPVGTGQVLGDTLSLPSGRVLEITGFAKGLTVESTGTVNLSGGAITTSQFDVLPGGVFNWTAGGLAIQAEDLVVDPGGPLGANPSIGAGQVLILLQNMLVGDSGTASFSASAGAPVMVGSTIVGAHATGDGTLLIDGPGTNWTSQHDGDFIVGRAGTGAATLSGGAHVFPIRRTVIGEFTGSNGELTLEDAGSLWEVSTAALLTDLVVGEMGTGVLNIAGGAVMLDGNRDSVVGDAGIATGTVNVDGAGSLWHSFGDIIVGRNGNGSLNITSGGTVTAGRVTTATTKTPFIPSHATISVDGDGSLFNPAFFNLAGFGTASLSITNGGDMLTQEIFAAIQAGSNASITVDGVGSTLIVDAMALNDISIGVDGTASLDVTSGGYVSADEIRFAENTGIGIGMVDGMGSSMESEMLVVGRAAAGSLTVSGGASVMTHQETSVGRFPGADGTVLLQDAGTTWTSPDVWVGGSSGAAGGLGEVAVNAGATLGIADTMIVWDMGTVNLSGGTLTADTIDHTHGGTFNFTDGTLSVNAFDGTLSNQGGTLSPGSSAGITSVTDDYLQGAAATLEMEIGGTESNTYDRLMVTGAAALGGVLDVDLIGGFSPFAGDRFELVTAAGGIDGTFDNEDLPLLSLGLTWYVDYGTSLVALEVFLLGDMDGDGDVDFDDVDDFILALENPIGYEAMFGMPPAVKGDIDGDSDLDFDDIDDFVGILNAPLTSAPRAVPEPSTAFFATIALLGLVGWKRKRERLRGSGSRRQWVWRCARGRRRA